MATLDPSFRSKNEIQAALRQLSWRYFRLSFLRAALLSTPVFLFFYGTIALAFRFSQFSTGISYLSFVWLGLAFILIGAIIFAYRSLQVIKDRFPELIDAKAQLGGMLMMNGEVGHAVSLKNLDESCLPTIEYKSGRHLLMMLLSVAFIAGAFLFPIEKLMQSKKMDLSGPITNYQNQIDVLEKEAVITPELAEQLEEQLNQISEKSSSIDPANTWQSLDQLADRISEEAALAAQNMVKESEDLSEIEEAAEDQANSVGGSGLEQMQALNDMLQKSKELNDAFKKGLSNDQELAEMLKALEEQMKEMELAQKTEAKLFLSDQLSPETRKRIEKELEKLGLDQKDRLSDLSQSEMRKLKELEKNSEGKTLESQLKELAEKLAKQELDTQKPLELTKQQLDDLKQRLADLKLPESDMALLENQQPALTELKEDTVIAQIFLNNEIEEEELAASDKIVEELKIPEMQYARVPLEILEGVRDVIADGKIEVIELDSLRPEIDLHLRSSFEMEPIEEEQLEQWEKKAADAGIAPEDFLVIKKGQCNCQGDGKSPDEDLVGLAQKMKEMKKAMADKLKEMAKSGALSQAMAARCQAAMGGQGAPSRGGGPSPMSFGRERDPRDSKFDPIVLPLNKINMEQSQLMAVEKSDAKNLQPKNVDTTTVLEEKKSLGESIRNTILPQHRQYLEKFREQRTGK